MMYSRKTRYLSIYDIDALRAIRVIYLTSTQTAPKMRLLFLLIQSLEAAAGYHVVGN